MIMLCIWFTVAYVASIAANAAIAALAARRYHTQGYRSGYYAGLYDARAAERTQKPDEPPVGFARYPTSAEASQPHRWPPDGDSGAVAARVQGDLPEADPTVTVSQDSVWQPQGECGAAESGTPIAAQEAPAPGNWLAARARVGFWAPPADAVRPNAYRCVISMHGVNVDPVSAMQFHANSIRWNKEVPQ